MSESLPTGDLRPILGISTAEVGAAPHLPAGILSPYSDGERGALIHDFANYPRCRKALALRPAPFSPSLYGEKVPAGG
ncbi:hypothetical protein BQ8794_200116 [Mesorhizobium prunaredense]|uniref:Uncharacterized protein n=1 Tax=Mesorhizobium prunaredense TaxID=1631249 RepID=A0A1R3V5C4_9HYPH|nr:hypothetical protein BQ8794_200116 [Mesorhizobium prunaredense]